MSAASRAQRKRQPGEPPHVPDDETATSVDIVVPVYNEERDVPKNIPVLRDFLLASRFPYRWRIVISDNGSTDRTPEEARRLADRFPGEVEYVRIESKAKGLAVKSCWAASPMDIVSFMDVDLSTDLKHFPALIDAVACEGYDIAVGSRTIRGGRVRRSWKRRVLTSGYNRLVRLMFGVRFHDAQCGFKAARSECARRLLPAVRDESWFFDTELLLLAEMSGCRIKELPITWVEDRRTSVRIFGIIATNLRGLLRMRLTRLPGDGRGVEQAGSGTRR